MISLYITNAAMRLLEFTGVIMTGGQFIITFYTKYLFQSSFSVAEEAGLGLCLGISIVLILFPARNINERFF
jgi:TRAP-type C4-dicarboxylate transport system permease small subunit